MLEVIVYLPRAAGQFGREVEVHLGRHIVVVAAPLRQPEALLRGAYLLVAHLRVGEPRLGIGLTDVGLHLCRLALIIALVDILQVHQVDGLAAIRGIYMTAFGVGVAMVKVGEEHLKAQVVARGVSIVLAFVEHPVAGLDAQCRHSQKD